MKKIIIFGLSEIAEIAHYYFKHDSQYIVSAFTVDRDYINQNSFCDLPIVPFENLEEHYPPNDYDMFIAVSYAQVNRVREKKFNQAKKKGYSLISYVSSKATVWPDLSIGQNCFILEDNTVQPFVKIGDNVTLWSGNHIGHHSVINANCFISSHVVISGGVIIGKNCFLGVNSTIHDHINIGENCIIGAGAVITKSIDGNGIYVGNPAKLIKTVETI